MNIAVANVLAQPAGNDLIGGTGTQFQPAAFRS
jgi:hypothetical protein